MNKTINSINTNSRGMHNIRREYYNNITNEDGYETILEEHERTKHPRRTFKRNQKMRTEKNRNQAYEERLNKKGKILVSLHRKVANNAAKVARTRKY